MRGWKLYFRYWKLHLLSAIEYKGWWLSFVHVMILCFLDPIETVLLFQRFGNIGVWSQERILLIYALAVASYGLAEFFFRGYVFFPTQMVRNGSFDRLLLRPRSLFLQTAASVFQIQRMARPLAGLLIVCWALSKMEVVMTLLKLLVLISALCGGTAMYTGSFVLTSALSIFTIKGVDWIVVFTNASYQVARIPYDHMPELIKNIFIFLMPMLVVSYFPASVICGWGLPLWMGFLSFPAGLLFLFAALLVWKIGVKQYKSTGS